MSEKILLSLSEQRIILEPGSAGQSTVSIYNRSSIVDQFTVEVEGLDEDWYDLSASSVKLFPGDEESTILTFHPPRDASSKAGKYPFSVKATSVDNPTETATELGTLEIRPFHDFEAKLHPTRRETRAKAHFQVTVTNRSNCAQTYTLNASDEEAACEFQFKNDEVQVDPGESEVADFHVTSKKRPKFGVKKQYAFTLRAAPEGSEEAAHKLSGQAVFLPMIPKWVLTVVAPLLIISLIVLWLLWPVDKPVIEQFTVSPESITVGDSAAMYWNVLKAKSVMIEPEPGNVAVQGTLTVTPSKTTLFTLTAKNRKGSKKQSKIELEVIHPLAEITRFTASPKFVKNPKKGVKLSWEVHKAEKVKIQPNIGDVDSIGSMTTFPERTTTFTLIATNQGGDIEKGVEVILETDRASLEKEIQQVEQRMKDFIETGKHLYSDKHLFDQAVEKFQQSRQEYTKFKNKFGSESKLAKLDGTARDWIEKISLESDQESAYNMTKQLIDEKMASAKLFYQMNRFDEAKRDFQECTEHYKGFKEKFGGNTDLKKLSDSAQEWIEKMRGESDEATAFAETKQIMGRHIDLGKGFHNKGQYDEAVNEFEACRQKYQQFTERFGNKPDLDKLDKEAQQGIERAKLAKDIEQR